MIRIITDYAPVQYCTYSLGCSPEEYGNMEISQSPKTYADLWPLRVGRRIFREGVRGMEARRVVLHQRHRGLARTLVRGRRRWQPAVV